jgi:glycosyltransferase involved in cell wall biosynthesis
VYTNHGLRYSQKNTFAQRLFFKQLERFVCETAAAVVSIRPSDNALAIQDNLAPADRLHVVRTQLKVANSVRQVRPRLKPLLLGLGSLIQVKRPDVFLEWLDALQKIGVDYDACWLGDGPMRNVIEATARALGLQIRFTGQVSASEVHSFLSDATLLLLPSDFEVFPLSVIEAAAHGVPAVIRDFRGASDIVSHDVTGLITEDESPMQVAKLISRLLLEPDRLNLLGSQARANYDERFSDPEQTASSYASLYEAAISRNVRS